MAVNETVSAYSTTQASNTPSDTDNVGPDLDNHLANIKQNIRKAATHWVEDTAGAFDALGTRGAFWIDPSASPTLTLNYIPGTGGTIALAEINESASSVNPYFGTVKSGSFMSAFAGEDSTGSAHTALGFSAVGKELVTATSTAGAFNALGVSQAVQDFVTATDTAAMVNALGISTYGALLAAEESTASAVTTLGSPGTWTYPGTVATTGTSVVSILTGLPSTITEVELLFYGVSTNAANQAIVAQLGDGSAFATTGYNWATHIISNTATEGGAETAGMRLSTENQQDAASTFRGKLSLSRGADNTTWTGVSNGNIDGVNAFGAGDVALDTALTRVQITTTGGTATYDAGSVVPRYR